jgi:hypothetical protein
VGEVEDAASAGGGELAGAGEHAEPRPARSVAMGPADQVEPIGGRPCSLAVLSLLQECR